MARKLVLAIALLALFAALHLSQSDSQPSWIVFRIGNCLQSILSRLQSSLSPPHVWLISQSVSFLTTKALYLACKFSFADHLRTGPMSIQALSTLAKTDSDVTDRVMKFLAAKGVFSRVTEKVYANNEVSEMLMSEHPLHIRSYILHVDFMARAAEGFEVALKNSSAIPFQSAFQTDLSFWDYLLLPANREEKADFDLSMVGISNLEYNTLLTDYPWAKHGNATIVDVGGGIGHLTATLLRRHPFTGVICDTEATSGKAYWTTHYSDVLNRAQFAEQSFFESVWAGGDVYILKHILHDWDDESAVTILKQVATAMRKNTATLLVIDCVYDFPPANAFIANLDMLMLVFRGKERALEDFRALFQKAGLKLKTVVPLRAISSILEVELA